MSQVRALGWEKAWTWDGNPEHDREEGDDVAESPIGEYRVSWDPFATSSEAFVALWRNTEISRHAAPREAKAAAQVAFERRVLACHEAAERAIDMEELQNETLARIHKRRADELQEELEALKAATGMRMETGLENIARDIKERRFPKSSPPQLRSISGDKP